MKAIFFMLVACLLALPASAQARDWRPVFRAAAEQDGRRQANDSRQYRRNTDDRNGRYDRRSGRLTDEERRQLHQDLDRANRELYRRKPRR